MRDVVCLEAQLEVAPPALAAAYEDPPCYLRTSRFGVCYF